MTHLGKLCEHQQAGGHALCESSGGPACICPLPSDEISTMSECDQHKWVYRGVVYKISDRPLPGSGACEVSYFDLYFCERCITMQVHELDHKTNTYEPIAFSATPMPAGGGK